MGGRVINLQSPDTLKYIFSLLKGDGYSAETDSSWLCGRSRGVGGAGGGKRRGGRQGGGDLQLEVRQWIWCWVCVCTGVDDGGLEGVQSRLILC